MIYKSEWIICYFVYENNVELWIAVRGEIVLEIEILYVVLI